jgi:hypothetical protein
VCESSLEIVTAVKLVTGDGSLDEKVSLKLTTSAATTARFTLEIPAAKVKGTYLTKVTPDPGFTRSGVHVEGAFGDDFPGSHETVPGVWNGFVAARLSKPGYFAGVFTAHGNFPPQTGP